MEQKIIMYRNGNYTVTLDKRDGTKIRRLDAGAEIFNAAFPESMDIKICNRCDMNCPMCHENSTSDGDLGDIMSPSFIDHLRPGTELAIGGGNPLEHPDLELFLEKCKRLGLIPSITVNQAHFMQNLELLEKWSARKLIYGLGVSLIQPSLNFLTAITRFPNAVIHVIAGLVTEWDLEILKECNLKILILGYKQFRRGITLYDEAAEKIEQRKFDLKDLLPTMLNENWFKVISFDNLALAQLGVKEIVEDTTWEKMYMGDDGSATMYVDMVKREYAVSSTSIRRYPLPDTIDEAFARLPGLKEREILKFSH